MAGRALLLAAVLALGSGGAACGSSPVSPAPAVQDAAARLEALNAEDARLARVSWRLTLANADLCPATRLRAGWAIHAAAQYGAELRPVAISRYGLDGDLPGILLAPQGSPAAAAGLSPGDVIVAVNGEALSPGNRAARESYDGLQANLERLDGAVARGPARLTVRREGVERVVALQPVRACAYDTQITIDRDPGGHAGKEMIQITTGMAGLAASDDELAFIVAHELAHAVLEHVDAPADPGRPGARNGELTLRRGANPDMEADADRLALYLLARAGYDPATAVAVLDRYSAGQLFAAWPQISVRGRVYRPPAERRPALAPVLADIAARRAEGRPLIP